MTLPALTAVTHRWESDLAAHLDRSGHVHVARRCADLAELLGCAAAGIARVAAVSVDLRGLDASTVAELGGYGVRVLGVHPPADEVGARTLRRWGVSEVVSADAGFEVVEAALAVVVSEPAVRVPEAGSPLLAPADPRPAADPEGGDGGVEGRDPAGPDGGRGSIVTVWGPTGAPGRTTVAVNLAAELGTPDAPSLLVDADTYGAAVAQCLGVLDEAPGLAAAVRAADQGLLDRPALARLAPQVQPGVRVLTGLPRADRWPELREHAVADVLQECTRLARWTVVDAGFCLERDEELSFDTAAPRRNGASLAAVSAADTVVVVGRADPVGLQRLVRAVDELAAHTVAPQTVVVNRVRAAAVGRDPDRRIRDALQRFAGVSRIHVVPDDPAAVDTALLRGRTLAETRPGSPAHQAIVRLADGLRGPVAERRRRRRAHRWRAS
ncbi:AAA family ATPase [Ornithinimicrobium sediminis]|uniref:AAA family ATPase n=1 Tax=Ornithinimicrobium sediminis TaxID=2904603 RepID=UPI001E62365C|nr:hypothetical protein [Ornithinimicrobium sediminis]MCE0486490.1 hypothetical protein [Ornithinimicrobium sediminis]